MKPHNALPWLRERIRVSKQLRADRRIYSEFVAPGDLVFDVGANAGLKVRTFVDLGAQVVAFEPQSKCRAVLERRFRNDRVTIDARALSDREGVGRLLIPQSSTLASMTSSWIEAVKESGRFSEYSWHGVEEVVTTRLETAISHYGEPAFCKIDVEGNEEAVIAGLETPIRALSLEFTPEHRTGVLRSIDRLATLGDYEWRYAIDAGDGAEFQCARWMTSAAFRGFLSAYDRLDAGDVYARLRA